MSYFKRIGNTISVKSKEFVRNAKAVSETNSLNSIVKAEQQKIDTNYKMMGKLYFEKFSEGASEDFEEYVEAIKVSMARIDEVKEEIAKIKKRNCCPNCGARFRIDALFCSKCGTRVREEVPEEPVSKCPECGNVLEEGSLFCDNCGAKAVTESDAVVSEVSGEQTGNTGTAVDAVCEAQGSDEKSEPEQKADDGAVVSETSSDESAVSSKKTCPSCGAEQTDEEAAFCIECGGKL